MGHDAFISYSHSADGRLAPAIQSGLQRLARPWYRRRALRVFRDETGLSVNPHLWESIAAAMAGSRFFVLLASPEAASSPWVNRELEAWLASHPPDTVLPVLTDGTLVWDDARGDFDPGRSSALPAALAGAFGDEPRFLDLRWARDETQLDLRHSRFRGQIATLAAPIHGIPREDLEGEDVRLHRRALRLAWGAAFGMIGLTIVALSLAVVAQSSSRTATAQRRIAQDESAQSLSRQLAAEALNDETSRLDLALLKAVAANRVRPTPQSRDVLLKVLGAHPEVRTVLRPARGTAASLLVSPDGHTIATSNSLGGGQLWNRATRSIQAELPAKTGQVTAAAFGPDDELAVETTNRSGIDVRIGSAITGQTRTRIHGPYQALALAFSRDGSTLAIVNTVSNAIEIWNVAGAAKRVESFPVGAVGVMAFSPDGSTLAWSESRTGQPSSILIRRLHDPTPEESFVVDAAAGPLQELIFSPDGAVLESVATAGDDAVVFWNLASKLRTRSVPVRSGVVVAASPDQERIAVTQGSTTAIFDTQSGTQVANMPVVTTDHTWYQQGFTPDGKSLVVASALGSTGSAGSTDGTVTVFDVVPNPVAVGGRYSVLGGHLTPFLSDDGRLMVMNAPTGHVSVLDTASGRLIRQFAESRTARYFAFDPRDKTVGWTSDGQRAITVMNLATGHRLDARSEEKPVERRRRIGQVLGLTFSPDGRTVAVVHDDMIHSPGSRASRGQPAHDHPSPRVVFWDVGTGMRTTHFPPMPTGCCFRLEFLPGRALLVSGARGTNLMLRPGRAPQPLPLPLVDPVSVQGSVLVSLDPTHDGSVIHRWSTAQDRPFRTVRINAASGITTWAVDRHGAILATASGDEEGTVRLWDVASGSATGPTLHVGVGPVEGIRFFGTNRLLALTSPPGCGAISAFPVGLQSGPEFTPAPEECRYTVTSLNIGTRSLEQRACTMANRDLTRGEWADFIGADRLPYERQCTALLRHRKGR